MMNAIVDLRSVLAKANDETFSGFPAPAASPMSVTAHDIARLLSPTTKLDASIAFAQRLVQAIGRFRDDADNVDFRTLRLVCHGCCLYVEEQRYVPLADPRALASLVGCVTGYAHEARRFRRLFHGLLRAYLGVDRQADWFRSDTAQDGNEVLRQYLEGTFANFKDLEPTPDWVNALRSYPEVLAQDPGKRFAQDWLAGSKQDFQEAATGLSLTGASWLAAETLRSAVLAATSMDDSRFATAIPDFLATACEQRFQSLRDEIYASLVTRYSSMSSPVVHSQLRDALVAAWKNPWLARNDSVWGRVSDKARQMVASWLKLELIHQFFEVLSEDGRQDRSRFEFWRGYHERMDDVYFALGSRAYHSRSPDIAKLRTALDGRLLELVGTESDNNAFIMCMGDTVVVEFSKKGNAAYRYRRGELELNAAHRSIGIGGLKHDSSERMIHRDAKGFTWQERFARKLGRMTSASNSTPPQTRSLSTPLSRAPATEPAVGDQSARFNSLFAEPPGSTTRSQVVDGRSERTEFGRRTIMPIEAQPAVRSAAIHESLKVEQSSGSPTDNAIRQYCKQSGIECEDHRPKGGSLWLRSDDADPVVVQQLAAWGFKYRTGRGWWRSS